VIYDTAIGKKSNRAYHEINAVDIFSAYLDHVQCIPVCGWGRIIQFASYEVRYTRIATQDEIGKHQPTKTV
jgi:hypothetical protein